MRDNELIALVVDIIRVRLVAAGSPFSSVEVAQSYQPTQEGVPSGAAVFLYKVGDHKHGSVGRKDMYDEIYNEFTHLETQVYETTFQVSALYRQNPSNPFMLTASDLANRVSSIMQSDYALERLMKYGVGILRITDVRNPYFIDDKDRNEAAANFDFTLTYNRDIMDTVPGIESVEVNFDRV